MWVIRYRLGWWLFCQVFWVLPDSHFKDDLALLALDHLKPEDAPHSLEEG